MEKELDALKYLKDNKRRHWLEGDKSNESLEIIGEALGRLDKLERFIEILKREYIEIDVKNVGPLTVGNHYFTIGFNGTETKINITKEEYELLKEIFG